VTLALLWKECRGHHPDGYGYGRFCDLYVEWRHGITATMRQAHPAGEKLFVDFGGDTVPVFDGLTRRSAPPRSSSPSWGHRTTPSPKPASAKRCPIGAHVGRRTLVGRSFRPNP
jgi:transposase